MIIFNFDVLARPNNEFGARLPDPEGVKLWLMLHDQTLGRLAVVVDGDPKRDHLEHWLTVNGIKAAMYEILDTDDPVVKADKVHRISMAAGRSDWYIDVDPLTVVETLRLGIPSLLVANPYVVRPEWMESKGPRPWDQVVSEIERQKLIKANKTWGDSD